ncbi:MAG TPA: GNVR domain-containing protein [Steroidobacteraceae bacterium]|nr:GNVR domain-containing protein [Steroidobacteraceae bacterium]
MEKDSEFEVVPFFWIVWDQKYLVLAISLICGVIATIYALTATPMYRAQIVVTQARDNSMGGAGSLMGQLGGLASMAGLDLGANGENPERPAVLRSRGLVDAFIKRYSLAPVINRNTKQPTSDWWAVESFRSRVLDIHEEKLKSTTTITIDWGDPVVAARWANDFVGLANELLRARAIQESTRNLEYLNKQLPQTPLVEIQQAIYRLIEAETKSLMVAHGRAEYAFTIVDPAVVPEFRVSPRRTLMVVSALFAGGFLGSLVAWARKNMRRRPSIATS